MFSPSAKFCLSSPSPSLDKSYATFLSKYVRSDTETRLDLLQSTSRLDGFAFHSNDSICALSLFLNGIARRTERWSSGSLVSLLTTSFLK